MVYTQGVHYFCRTMAQTEDTELRDLVIEALEKNGSLAKIRALLRANVFLAFENECENIKQNVSLDNILNLPEGVMCLSLIHEFLEFCNLKNTLFVFMAESRQNKEYVYDGQKIIKEKLGLPKKDSISEPLLVTLLKNDKTSHVKSNDGNYHKDEQNCTYIVHEDTNSSGTSNSQSDNSSDEKNKLHLRLHLENSDTDTSSDSARDQSSSEYIPSAHVVPDITNFDSKPATDGHGNNDSVENMCSVFNNDKKHSIFLQELKMMNNSSDSTSYVELKPFNSFDKKLLNTAGLPDPEQSTKPVSRPFRMHSATDTQVKADPLSPATLSNVSSLSTKKEPENNSKSPSVKQLEEAAKSDSETAEYSFDFSSSPTRKREVVEPILNQTEEVEEVDQTPTKDTSMESQHQLSHSSRSSVSISDVADLISSSYNKDDNDKSHSSIPQNKFSTPPKNNTNTASNKLSDDSGDFSESPIPSLSNLSLDIHSD